MTTDLKAVTTAPTAPLDKWEQRFYLNAQLTHLDIELFEQDFTEMQAYLNQGTFEHENEGWRYLLATGYAYLRGKERLLLPDGSGIDPASVAENLRRQIEIESMYAVLKQRAYVWMTDYKTMDMQTGALHTTVAGYRALIDRLKEENQTLKTELKQLRQQLAQRAPQDETPLVTPVKPELPNSDPVWKRYLKRTKRG
ncbi:MAG TPA: hypothetical protein VMP08_07140 [Anaerolineae bacterium]|nr:hypothetical protein [Anaerolineae bacterium]